MKKLVFTLLMLLTLSMSAQENDVIKFMGIPVDGTKSEMIAQLKKKGFTLKTINNNEFLEGKFNGESVHVYVHTNNDVVDRIVVHQEKTSNESNIKIKFNNLVRQFNNNDKYFPEYQDQYIGEREDISYEMSVHSKRFQASFYQKHSKQEEDLIKQDIYDNYNVYLDKLLDNEALKEYADEIRNGEKDDNVNRLFAVIEFAYMMNNQVWFMISEFEYDEYYISIFYDNLRNRPNGEDL